MTRYAAATLVLFDLLGVVGLLGIQRIPPNGHALILPLGAGRELDMNILPVRFTTAARFDLRSRHTPIPQPATLMLWYQDRAGPQWLTMLNLPAWPVATVTIGIMIGSIFMLSRGRNSRRHV